jgi:hypothetical protein
LIPEGVKAKVYFQAQAQHAKGRTFLQVVDMKMDFSVRDIKMGIENLHNGNTVLRKFISKTATPGAGVRFSIPHMHVSVAMLRTWAQ